MILWWENSMKKLFVVILFISSTLFANTINIAVAANVSYAIDDLIKEFNKQNPYIKVRVTLGSSGKLTAQIKNAAPHEIFMSANMKYPRALEKDGLSATKPLVYAKGSLAILSSQRQDFSKGIDIVNEKNIEKIAIANPKTAPYGKASVEALKNAKLYKSIEKKFVYGESISQTVSFTVTAAQLGFVAKSLLYSDKMKKYKKGINWIDVDSKLYTPIEQGIIILKNAKENKEVKAFYDFILSQKAKEIFKEYGYLVQ